MGPIPGFSSLFPGISRTASNIFSGLQNMYQQQQQQQRREEDRRRLMSAREEGEKRLLGGGGYRRDPQEAIGVGTAFRQGPMGSVPMQMINVPGLGMARPETAQKAMLQDLEKIRGYQQGLQSGTWSGAQRKQVEGLMQNLQQQAGQRWGLQGGPGGQAMGAGGVPAIPGAIPGAGGGAESLMQDPQIQAINRLYDVGRENVQRSVGDMMQRAGLLSSGMTAEELSGQMQGLEAQRSAAIAPLLSDLLQQSQNYQLAQQMGLGQQGLGQQLLGGATPGGAMGFQGQQQSQIRNLLSQLGYA